MECEEFLVGIAVFDQCWFFFPDLFSVEFLEFGVEVVEVVVPLFELFDLVLADAEDHLGEAVGDIVPVGDVVCVGDDHVCGFFDVFGFVAGVVGLDVAGMEGLAVAGAVGVEGCQLVVFFEQKEVVLVGVAAERVEQGGAADASADDGDAVVVAHLSVFFTRSL